MRHVRLHNNYDVLGLLARHHNKTTRFESLCNSPLIETVRVVQRTTVKRRDPRVSLDFLRHTRLSQSHSGYVLRLWVTHDVTTVVQNLDNSQDLDGKHHHTSQCCTTTPESPEIMFKVRNSGIHSGGSATLLPELSSNVKAHADNKGSTTQATYISVSHKFCRSSSNIAHRRCACPTLRSQYTWLASAFLGRGTRP